MNAIRYVDRPSGKVVEETVMGDGALKFAYETLLGRTLWPVLFGSRLVSAILGRYYDSPRSRAAIPALANLPGCNPGEAEKPLAAYTSFNDFFTRRLKPRARPFGSGLASPADGRLLVYPNASLDRPFPLKGAQRTLRTVLALDNGTPGACTRMDIAVIRLAPVDYHRFHFPVDCRSAASNSRQIPLGQSDCALALSGRVCGQRTDGHGVPGGVRRVLHDRSRRLWRRDDQRDF